MVCTVAVVSSSFFAWVLGSAPAIRSLGLVQFFVIVAAQWFTFHHPSSTNHRSEWGFSLSGHEALVGVIGLSAISTFLTLVFNSLFMRFLEIPPFGFPVTVAMSIAAAAAHKSGVFVRPESHTHPSTNLAHHEHGLSYDWELVAQEMVKGVGSCLWLESWSSAGLIWAGIYICSPVLAFLGFLGAVVGTLTEVLLEWPADGIYAGYGEWEYIISSLVVGGLLYIVSFKTIVFGLVAAAFNAVATVAFQDLLGPMGLPT